ncbi:MAG TPA: hypothetical protein VHH52_10775, partial [Pseudonocardiaceae bacterium]|nr:hypothetical protein [Pseudonocardiaceae bacterium]
RTRSTQHRHRDQSAHTPISNQRPQPAPGLCNTLPDAEIILSQPGPGPVLGARVLARAPA